MEEIIGQIKKSIEYSFVRVKVCAQATGLPQKWLLSEADDGRIPCIYVGDSFRFHIPTVVKVLSQRSSKFIANGVGDELVDKS